MRAVMLRSCYDAAGLMRAIIRRCVAMMLLRSDIISHLRARFCRDCRLLQARQRRGMLQDDVASAIIAVA